MLRNCNNFGSESGDTIILHWDSDDWSHPRRIEEQAALLQSSGKEAVGYRDMLFWQWCKHCSTDGVGWLPLCPKTCPQCKGAGGEAWLYTYPGPPRYALGTSLCYWRSVWEKRPFLDTSAGEDTIWVRDVDCLGPSSLIYDGRACEPRMIASIHGGNTYAKIEPRAAEFRRVPEWDAHCREIMKL